MKDSQRGEIATIIAIGALVFVAVSTIVSSTFVNNKPKTTSTKAAGSTCTTLPNIPPPDSAPPGYHWVADCNSGYLLRADIRAQRSYCVSSSECLQNTEFPDHGYVTAGTSNFCYGGFGGVADQRCMILHYDAVCPGDTCRPAPTATPIPTNTQAPQPTNTPVPRATNTPVPVPTGRPTNTPVPVATNTPVPPPGGGNPPTATPPPGGNPPPSTSCSSAVNTGGNFNNYANCTHLNGCAVLEIVGVEMRCVPGTIAGPNSCSNLPTGTYKWHWGVKDGSLDAKKYVCGSTPPATAPTSCSQIGGVGCHTWSPHQLYYCTATNSEPVGPFTTLTECNDAYQTAITSHNATPTPTITPKSTCIGPNCVCSDTVPGDKVLSSDGKKCYVCSRTSASERPLSECSNTASQYSIGTCSYSCPTGYRCIKGPFKNGSVYSQCVSNACLDSQNQYLRSKTYCGTADGKNINYVCNDFAVFTPSNDRPILNGRTCDGTTPACIMKKDAQGVSQATCVSDQEAPSTQCSLLSIHGVSANNQPLYSCNNGLSKTTLNCTKGFSSGTKYVQYACGSTNKSLCARTSCKTADDTWRDDDISSGDCNNDNTCLVPNGMGTQKRNVTFHFNVTQPTQVIRVIYTDIDTKAMKIIDVNRLFTKNGTYTVNNGIEVEKYPSPRVLDLKIYFRPYNISGSDTSVEVPGVIFNQRSDADFQINM
jgi:hypothetical protein